MAVARLEADKEFQPKPKLTRPPVSDSADGGDATLVPPALLALHPALLSGGQLLPGQQQKLAAKVGQTHGNRYLQRAVANEGQADDPARALIGKGADSFEAKDYETAIKLFQDALKISGLKQGSLARAVYNLGLAHYRLKQWDQARAMFEQFLVVSANMPEAEKYRAAVQEKLKKLDNMKKASDGARAASAGTTSEKGSVTAKQTAGKASKDADPARGLIKKGVDAIDGKDYSRAASYFLSVIAMPGIGHRKLAQATYDLAYSYYELKQWAKAKEMYDQFLRICSGLPNVEQYRLWAEEKVKELDQTKQLMEQTKP